MEGSRIFFFQAEDGIRYLTVTGVQTCALPISSPRRRAQHQPVSRFALDPRAGVDEREILAFRPKRQQVVVVRTAGLARLARHARRDRAVPVGEVEDLSIGRAPTLLVTLARGGVDGVGITAPRHVS